MTKEKGTAASRSTQEMYDLLLRIQDHECLYPDEEGLTETGKRFARELADVLKRAEDVRTLNKHPNIRTLADWNLPRQSSQRNEREI